MSLSRKTVLVTRRADQSHSICKEIERRGGIALVYPLIEIADPTSWDECDRALDRITDYTAVVFTSSNAVERLRRRAAERWAGSDRLQGVRSFAVGEATAEAALRAGLHVEPLPTDFTGHRLAAMITATRNHGARFLFPCGDLARDEVPAALSEAGAIVDRVVVYRTVRAESSGYESLRERLLGRGIDVVTFASPSAVSGFVEVFQDVPLADLSRLARIAVIGPTTAAAVRTAGGSPDIVARVSSAAGLVQAIDDYYQT